MREDEEGYKWVTKLLSDWTARVKNPNEDKPVPPPAGTRVESDPISGDTITAMSDRDVSKPVLRARSEIAGPEVVEETPEQQMDDVVAADTFSYKPPHDEDIGNNNLVALQDDFNEQNVRFAGPLYAPRACEGPNVSGFVVDSRWNECAGPTSVVYGLRDHIVDQQLRARTHASHGSQSVALSPDNSTYPDPAGRASHTNPFIPAQEQPGSWEVPFLPAFSNDVFGMKRDDNTMRAELMQEAARTVPRLPREMQLHSVLHNGFD